MIAVCKRQPFFGWVVVWAAFVTAIFGWGVGFYGPPVFLKAVQDARGWSVSLVSAAVTLHFLVGAVVVASLPRLHRRFGLPAVTTTGAAVLAVGVVGWSLAQEPWQLFLATLLSGGGWVTLGAAAINAMVSPWFVRRRPAALSTAYNGASIGGVVFSPLWVALIGWGGFPLAAAMVGVVMVTAVGLLASRVLNRSPAELGLCPDGASEAAAALPAQLRHQGKVAALWADAAFLTLALGMALGLFAQIGLMAHLYSLLAPALGTQGAGLAAGMATAAAIMGRTLAGWLMPPDADRRVVAACSFGVQALGCAALLLAGGSSIPLLLAGVAMVGLGIGNATSLPPLIAQVEFAKEDLPRVVALVTATSQATYALAPVAFGILRDLGAVTGSAATLGVFLAAGSIQLMAAMAYLGGRKRFRRR
jgi:MFS family permease